MKLIVNKGVRDTIAELERLFDEQEVLVGRLANPAASYEGAINDGFDKQALERRIVNMAARLLSHATRGRRFPNMTKEYRREKQW
jgi:hypothetical protein